VSVEWPELPLDGWRETYETLHLWSQVLGKIALAKGPQLPHCWGSALQLGPRGLSTRPLHHGDACFTVEMDWIDHCLLVRTSHGQTRSFPLEPRTVADFYAETIALLAGLGLVVRIWPVSVETAAPVPLDRDGTHRSYEREPVERLHRILLSTARVFTDAATGFLGKASPVHFFWGSFDLASTRFSGRRAPPMEGPAFMRDAYSHEVISHGFWPGGWSPNATLDEPVFYAYAAPAPDGLAEAPVRPDAARWHPQLREYVVPYEAVSRARAPAAELRAFVDSTYGAAADLARWDRAALDRPRPG
jgi:hypothetical protein